jgi:hypothetical protein
MGFNGRKSVIDRGIAQDLPKVSQGEYKLDAAMIEVKRKLAGLPRPINVASSVRSFVNKGQK